jgi:RNA polymerase sigma factor (sigma-70 family)
VNKQGSSFQEFYSKSQQGLLASIQRHKLSQDDTQDIFQEVMEEMSKIYKRNNESFGSLLNPPAYAHSILFHKIARLKRSEMLNEKLHDSLAQESSGFVHNPESLAQARDTLTQVSKVLQHVDEAPRLCFIMFKDGYSIKEISDRMQIPLSTVYHYKSQVEAVLAKSFTGSY